MHLLPSALALLCLATIDRVAAQKSSDTTTTTSSHKSSTTTSSKGGSGVFGTLSTLSSFSIPAFTGSKYSYASPSSQITLDPSLSISSIDYRSGSASASASGSGSGSRNATASPTGSSSASSTSSKKQTVTHLVGSAASTSTTNGTASSTSSSATPTNTVPCNGYPEFCSRQYSNITQVCAHNSAFSIPNNAASNQVLSVTMQLEDGVRMIQGETHFVNGTIMNCHTSCELLNAGTWLSELQTVGSWLRSNPYEVVTWLIVNSDFINVKHYAQVVEQAGLLDLVYVPEFVPQHRQQWPTLGEMILSGKRLVMFMDYNANQTAFPYILDEFTHIWETPFSPTNPNFPCTQQRPPGLSHEKAMDQFMYLANHNLNTAVDVSAILGTSVGSGGDILIPNSAAINNTNGLYLTSGQMGRMTENCTSMWGRPPQFLLVDYFNYGDPYQGSVLEVAAKANGVHYNKNSCCGARSDSAAASLAASPAVALMVAAALGLLVLSAL